MRRGTKRERGEVGGVNSEQNTRGVLIKTSHVKSMPDTYWY
jgi:hypothetical protein